MATKRFRIIERGAYGIDVQNSRDIPRARSWTSIMIAMEENELSRIKGHFTFNYDDQRTRCNSIFISVRATLRIRIDAVFGIVIVSFI